MHIQDKHVYIFQMLLTCRFCEYILQLSGLFCEYIESHMGIGVKDYVGLMWISGVLRAIHLV